MTGRPRLYHWSNLLRLCDSTFEFTLLGGVDYRCSQRMLVQQVRNQLSSRELHGRIEQIENGVTVTISSSTEDNDK